jgi:hypothetical protein
LGSRVSSPRVSSRLAQRLTGEKMIAGKTEGKKSSRNGFAGFQRALFVFFRYVFFLIFAVTLGAAVWLIRLDGKARAEAREAMGIERHLQEVLPVFDNQPSRDVFWVAGKEIFPAFRRTGEKKPGRFEEIAGERTPILSSVSKLAGFAFETQGHGYGGELRLLIGWDASGKVSGVKLLSEQGPPVFGDLFAAQREFFESFKGQSWENLKSSPESGSMDTVSPVTMNTRGVIEAVRAASLFFSRHRNVLMKEAAERGALP